MSRSAKRLRKRKRVQADPARRAHAAERGRLDAMLGIYSAPLYDQERWPARLCPKWSSVDDIVVPYP